MYERIYNVINSNSLSSHDNNDDRETLNSGIMIAMDVLKMQ